MKFMHPLALLALSVSVYFICYERNNWIFYQIYRSYQDACEDIFYLIQSCSIELEPRFHIPATFRSIWHPRELWDTTALTDFKILFRIILYVINQFTSSSAIYLHNLLLSLFSFFLTFISFPCYFGRTDQGNKHLNFLKVWHSYFV